MKTIVITMAMLMTTSAVAVAQDEVAVPKEALQWMASIAGEWEANGTVNGNKIQGTHSAKWAPGKHCIQFTQHWTGAIPVNTAGIGGWSPDRKQYVEHWYWSNGSYRTHWYSPGKEKGVWVGGFTQVDKDGKKSSGKIRLETGAEAWKLVGIGDVDGEKTMLTFKKKQ